MGIYIIFGHIRYGKSMFATKKAIERLINNYRLGLELKALESKKKPNLDKIEHLKSKIKAVFSNYPVIYEIPLTKKQKLINFVLKLKHKKLIEPIKLSTYIWRPEYIRTGLIDSECYVDEAYRYFGSRFFKEFTKDDHLGFATVGQNTTDYYLIAQHPDRLDVIIREITSIFYKVTKFPKFFNLPWWVTVTAFENESDIERYRETHDSEYMDSRLRFRPKKSILRAYDTHYFRKRELNTNFEKWIDHPELIDKGFF